MVDHRSTSLPECGPTEYPSSEPCYYNNVLLSLVVFYGPVLVNNMKPPPPQKGPKFSYFSLKEVVQCSETNEKKICNISFLRYCRICTQNSQNLPGILTKISDQKCQISQKMLNVLK